MNSEVAATFSHTCTDPEFAKNVLSQTDIQKLVDDKVVTNR